MMPSGVFSKRLDDKDFAISLARGLQERLLELRGIKIAKLQDALAEFIKETEATK